MPGLSSSWSPNENDATPVSEVNFAFHHSVADIFLRILYFEVIKIHLFEILKIRLLNQYFLIYAEHFKCFVYLQYHIYGKTLFSVKKLPISYPVLFFPSFAKCWSSQHKYHMPALSWQEKCQTTLKQTSTCILEIPGFKNTLLFTSKNLTNILLIHGWQIGILYLVGIIKRITARSGGRLKCESLSSVLHVIHNCSI